MLLIYEKIHKKQKETSHCFYKHKQMETLRCFSINILLSTEKNEYKFPPSTASTITFSGLHAQKIYVFKNILKKKCNFKHLFLIAIYVWSWRLTPLLSLIMPALRGHYLLWAGSFSHA